MHFSLKVKWNFQPFPFCSLSLKTTFNSLRVCLWEFILCPFDFSERANNLGHPKIEYQVNKIGQREFHCSILRVIKICPL